MPSDPEPPVEEVEVEIPDTQVDVLATREVLVTPDEGGSNMATTTTFAEFAVNPIRLDLQTAGLSLQLNTQPVSVQLIELSAKLDLTTSQLKESQTRLETAFFRIGFLEAQLEQKEQELRTLRSSDSANA